MIQDIIKTYIIHRLGGKTNEEHTEECSKEYYKGKSKGAIEVISSITTVGLNTRKMPSDERIEVLVEHIQGLYAKAIVK